MCDQSAALLPFLIGIRDERIQSLDVLFESPDRTPSADPCGLQVQTIHVKKTETMEPK